jgi:hypothetical protein
MKTLDSLALRAVAAFLILVPAHASDIVNPGGGTLAEIMDGSGTNSIITLVNLQSAAASYTLSFFDDNGAPLPFSTTAGVGSAISGTLPALGSTIIQTNGGSRSITAGYATLSTSTSVQIAGSVVFGLTLSNGIFAQASVPLDTGEDSIFGLPFDETGDAASAQTGVALANSSLDGQYQPLGVGETALIQVSFFDQNGYQTSLGTITLPFGSHTAFMLDTKYPQLVGQKGTVLFVGADASNYFYYIRVLGIHATPTTYTSITPLVPCNPQFNSAGQYLGCGN